jgi:hypothetical protein
LARGFESAVLNLDDDPSPECPDVQKRTPLDLQHLHSRHSGSLRAARGATASKREHIAGLRIVNFLERLPESVAVFGKER